MRRAVAALRTLTVAASLAAASLTITAPQATAAGPPATGRIAFFDFVTNQIYAVNPDGTGLAQLTHEPDGIAARDPAWSPDGSHILFARFNLSNNASRIWIMKADGTGRRRLASDAPGYSDQQPKYTPDSRHIVFTRCAPDDGCAIWIMRSNGTHLHLVIPSIASPNETNNFYPVVSPDGRRITYARFGFDGIRAQVWVARIDGGHAHPLTAPRLEATQPNWSPDGSHIVFASNSDRPQSSIEVMRANGTAVTRLATTKWPTNNFLPAYSPDGTQIAFSSDRRHPDLCCEELFVMRADGSHQHLVDTGLQGAIGAAWGTAPPVAAGSPGTLSRLPADERVPGVAPYGAACREAPSWTTSMWCPMTPSRR
jgi:Tol biopolymer transport system component